MRGSRIPYGYKMSNGRYVLEEKEAKIVKIVFEMAASGKLPNEILKIVRNMDTDYFMKMIVECVKVMSKTEIEITFKGGFDMTLKVET